MKTIVSGRFALLAVAIPLTLALTPAGVRRRRRDDLSLRRRPAKLGLRAENQRRGSARDGLAEHRRGGVQADRRRLRQAAAAVPRAVEVRGIHYAHVAAAGELQVELTAAEPVRNFTIHPKRRGIQATADGRVLRFTIDRREPRYFIVEVNDLPPCCLLVDPPEEGAPSPTAENVVNAARFLTDATGKVEQTDGFARAIAAVNGTGKTLYVPPGIYLTDTIKIHKASNLGMYLAPGCLIRIKTSPRGENRHAPGISIDQSKRITISGRGCLDHQAYENFALEGNRYNHLVEGDYRVPVLSQAPVLILRSQDIAIRDITVRNGRNWNVNVVGCDRVTLLRCKILTPPACVPEFTDGIDVVSTDGLTIDGCFIHCNDDCLAWGNTLCFASPMLELAQSRELSHCVVRGLVAWNPRANGIRFGEWGTSSMVGIRDILFENCDFCGMAASGLFIGGLVQDPKSPQPPSYGTLRLVDCGFDCDRVKRYVFLMRKVRIERLEMENVVVDVAGKAAVFEGVAKGAIGRLVFRNLSVGGKKARQSQAGGHPREERGQGGCRVSAAEGRQRGDTLRGVQLELPVDTPPGERHNGRPMTSRSAARGANSKTSGAWMALALLLSMNLFNYIDRYVLAAVEPEIRQDLLHAGRGRSPRPHENRPALHGLSGLLHGGLAAVRLAGRTAVAVAADRRRHRAVEPGQRGQRAGRDLYHAPVDALPGGRRRGRLRTGRADDHRRFLSRGQARASAVVVLHGHSRRQRVGLRAGRLRGRLEPRRPKLALGVLCRRGSGPVAGVMVAVDARAAPRRSPKTSRRSRAAMRSGKTTGPCSGRRPSCSVRSG